MTQVIHVPSRIQKTPIFCCISHMPSRVLVNLFPRKAKNLYSAQRAWLKNTILIATIVWRDKQSRRRQQRNRENAEGQRNKRLVRRDSIKIEPFCVYIRHRQILISAGHMHLSHCLPQPIFSLWGWCSFNCVVRLWIIPLHMMIAL